MKLGQQVRIYPHPTAPGRLPMLGLVTCVHGDGTYDVLAMPGGPAMKAYNFPPTKALVNVRAGVGPVGTPLEKYRGGYVIYPLAEGPVLLRESLELLEAAATMDRGGDVMMLNPDLPATGEATTAAKPKSGKTAKR